MRSFDYHRAQDLSDALRQGNAAAQGQTDAPTQYLAGGTTLIDLMKLAVLTPRALIDLKALRGDDASAVSSNEKALRLSAFASMAAVADHPQVKRAFPVIADSLALAASPQLRNMATLGGNVLQRTRCPFFRDPTFEACNKRSPGTGCQAMHSVNRNHAILGTDASCISQYPGDFAVALVALDAMVEVAGQHGSRQLPLRDLHVGPAGHPHIETSLRNGEIITAFHIPHGPWTSRSRYLKIRDRASYEFAIASCAVALELKGDTIVSARLGLGGMAYKPWRAHEAENYLAGKTLTEEHAQAAAVAALHGAKTHGHNDYKPELARRSIVRALLEARSMQPEAAA